MREVKTIKKNGRVFIEINGKIYPPMSATISNYDRDNEKVVIDKEYFKSLGESGIKLFFVASDTEWGHPGIHEKFVEECQAILDVVPDAYFIVRIGLNPPVGFLNDKKDDCFTLSNGEIRPVKVTSFSYGKDHEALYALPSKAWRSCTEKALLETIDFHRNSKVGDRIVGYFLCAWATSEWYAHIPYEVGEAYGDVSKATQIAFKEYLKEMYESEEDLQKAWNDEKVTFENACVPGRAERYYTHDYDDLLWDKDKYVAHNGKLHGNGTNDGNFASLQKSKNAIDYHRFIHLVTADVQIQFAKVIKNAFNGNILTGAFYGGFGCTDYFRCGTAGATLRILDSGYMDFLSTPGVYVNRQPGGFEGQRSIEDSYTLRNCFFFAEQDTRTHLENLHFRNLFDYYDIEDSINILKRDFGKVLSRGTYAWWFDQHLTGGRYKHPDMYKLFSKQQEIAHLMPFLPPKKNEIAFIYDEESLSYISNQSTKESVEYFRNYEVERLGLGVDYYFHNDLSNEKMPDYKLYVFFNTFALTKKEREDIKKKLSKNHAVAIWVYASGYIDLDNNQMSLECMSDLTGINLDRLDIFQSGKYRFNEKADKYINIESKKVIYGDVSRPVNGNILTIIEDRRNFNAPIFVPNDDNATVIASYVNQPISAVAVKDTGNFTSVYHGSKILSSKFVREWAKYAGCHIYNETEHVLYTDGNTLTLHASYDDEIIINLPKTSSVEDIYTKELISEATNSIKVVMNKGETKTYLIKEKTYETKND